MILEFLAILSLVQFANMISRSVGGMTYSPTFQDQVLTGKRG